MVKTLMLAAFVAVSVCSCTADSGKKCIVEGNLQGVEGEEWIYMVDAWNGKEVLDSTKCKDGTFLILSSMIRGQFHCPDRLKGTGM